MTGTDAPMGHVAAITLLEFNRRIRDVMLSPGLQNCWVTAETSDVRVNRGHCYMELLQKNPDTGATLAKAPAAAWASTFAHLDANFFAATGSHLASGMKVMVRVSATFHEQYGIKLIVNDIDPNFTLGDMARQRMEILRRLKAEGIIDMNRELGFPLVPQRIAVISARGAAGYGDFMRQLADNQLGISYYTCLFQSPMQGVNTAAGIIAALERIRRHERLFDCVVIIRGGGSTTDLNSFDNYDLAACIARFPLPVVTGIGHDRDVTVLDYVAAKHLKTPTAVAEFIVSFGQGQMTRLTELSNAIATAVRKSVAASSEHLAYVSSMIPALARHVADKAAMQLERYASAIPQCVSGRVRGEQSLLAGAAERIMAAVDSRITLEKTHLGALTDKVELLSPRNTLNRGYSLTMCNGRIITDASQLRPGDTITSHFKAGRVRSTVKQQ